MNNVVLPPKVNFTKDELETIKKVTDPNYNKLLTEQEMNKLFGKHPETKEQFIKDQLAEFSSPDDNKVYPINTLNIPEGEIKMINQPISIDPNTGLNTPITEDELNEKEGLDLDLDQIDDFDINSIDFKDSDAESITSLFGIEAKESMELLTLIREVKNGNDKHLYSRFPKSMRSQLVHTCGSTNTAQLNKTAKDFIDIVISQIGTDNAFVDLETGIQNATNELVTGYKELARESIQIEDDDYNIRLKLYVDDLKENHPEKVDDINKWTLVRDRYLAAIDFSELKEAILSNPKLSKKLDKYTRLVREFNYKYSNETKKTKFACRDINYATNVLARALDAKEYPDALIKKFISVFCKYVDKYDATNIYDHTYMYFTVKTIVSLETLNYKEERYTDILSSIKEILNILKEE